MRLRSESICAERAPATLRGGQGNRSRNPCTEGSTAAGSSMVRCGIVEPEKSMALRDLSSLSRLPAPLAGAWMTMSMVTLSQAASAALSSLAIHDSCLAPSSGTSMTGTPM